MDTRQLTAVLCPECGCEQCMPFNTVRSKGTPLCPCRPGGVRMEIDGQGPCDNHDDAGHCLGHPCRNEAKHSGSDAQK
jgi:hypothetical protein